MMKRTLLSTTILMVVSQTNAEPFGVDVSDSVDADQWRCAVDAGLVWQVTRAWHRYYCHFFLASYLCWEIIFANMLELYRLPLFFICSPSLICL